MKTAPLYHDVARGPEGGNAFWVNASDGVQLRLGLWPASSGSAEKGTVLMFPGRTEYIEKYGPLAAAMSGRGYATLVIDWRGQGLAERAHKDRGLGHVGHFDEFQADVDAMLETAGALDLPRPYYLMSHSMGGCIALRALHREVPVQASVFSSPMWGILIPPEKRLKAKLGSWLGHHLGLGKQYVPETEKKTYVSFMPFEGNDRTTDAGMYTFQQEQAVAYPALALAGPSLSWLHAALSETRALAAMPAPATPTVTFLGTRERIVDPEPIRAQMERWPEGVLEIAEEAEHELLMERVEIRERFYDAAEALFSRHR